MASPFERSPQVGRRMLWLLGAGLAAFALSALHGRRDSSAPADEPDAWERLKQIGGRLLTAVVNGRLLTVAAGAAFYALLALFPGVTALVSLYGLFADPASAVGHVSQLRGVLPDEAVALISEQTSRIAAKGKGTLGLAFFSALALSLWSAMSGMKGIFEALTVIDGGPETRSFLQFNMLALAFTLGSIVFTILAVTVLVAAPAALAGLGFAGPGEKLIGLARWPLLYLGIVLYLTVLYRYGPCNPRFRWRWVTVGSVLAGLLWLGMSSLFALYVGNLGRYNETYGSLGAVIAFMTWLWLSISVIVLGALVNAELTAWLPRLDGRQRAAPERLRA